MFSADGFSADLTQQQRAKIQDLLFKGFPENKSRMPFDICPFEWFSWHANNSMIGVAAVHPGFYGAFLFNFTIRPDMCGRGHGRAFLGALENWLAKKMDITSLLLYAAPTAERFYEKCGYTKTGETDPETNFLQFTKSMSLDQK